MSKLIPAAIWIIASLSTASVTCSTVEIAEGENNELLLTVISSKPETSYSGKLELKKSLFGHRSTLTQQYKSGEESCLYMPVVGIRNLTCNIWLVKYWDTDMEVTLSDSEGSVIAETNVTASGRRSPYAVLEYKNIPRPDIVSLCARNHGTTKTVFHTLFLSEEHKRRDYIRSLDNLYDTHNRTAEALDHLSRKISQILNTESDGEFSAVRQDYYRLLAISSWVDNRCIINSVLMIVCGAGTTILIRRLFGTPMSNV